MVDTPAPWYKRSVEMLAATACIVLVLLVTASNPSYDELVKGLLAGVSSYVLTQSLPKT